VFEHPSKSGIWWVNYYVDGKRHREKVGTRKAASDLYSKRKNDARVGVKLPDSLKAKKAVLFEELAEDAMEYSKAHKRSHRGDVSNLSSLLPVFGKMKAEEITPQTISAYFGTRTDLKPASINRCRSTLSMIFAEGNRAADIELALGGAITPRVNVFPSPMGLPKGIASCPTRTRSESANFRARSPFA
jgi:hypothetical protein